MLFHFRNILTMTEHYNAYYVYLCVYCKSYIHVLISSLFIGDATPMDLWDFRSWPKIPQNKGRSEPIVLTPHLIKHLYGDVTPKFIIQLREPIERYV
jgi:hypothetical protein